MSEGEEARSQEVEVEAVRETSWLVRICKVCEACLGSTMAAIVLKRCPECGAPTIPVENVTMAVRVEARFPKEER